MNMKDQRLPELYHFYGATCGLKARLTLAEKEVDYQNHAIDRSYLITPEYRALNPNAVVPTLVHNDEVFTESTVIINYIEDAFSGPPLKPATAAAAARALWWMKYADDCLTIIGILTYTVSMRPKILGGTSREVQDYIDSIPDSAKRERRRKILQQGYENPEFVWSVHGMQQMLSQMETVLATNKWLAGADYSLADIAMAPLVERLSELQWQDAWSTLPGVVGWWQRAQSRPSYKTCVLDRPNPDEQQHKKQGSQA